MVPCSMGDIEWLARIHNWYVDLGIVPSHERSLQSF